VTWRVGSRWVNVLLDQRVGRTEDHPVECQRIYLAVLGRQPGRRPTEWVIDATLDDLDVTARWMLRHVTGLGEDDRRSLRRSSARFELEAVRLAEHPAYRGGFVQTRYRPVWAYRAFKPAGQHDRFYPTRHLCPTLTSTEGILEPAQVTSPRVYRFWTVWLFTPLDSLATSPGRRPRPEPLQVTRRATGVRGIRG